MPLVLFELPDIQAFLCGHQKRPSDVSLLPLLQSVILKCLDVPQNLPQDRILPFHEFDVDLFEFFRIRVLSLAFPSHDLTDFVVTHQLVFSLEQVVYFKFHFRG